MKFVRIILHIKFITYLLVVMGVNDTAVSILWYINW